MKERKGGRKEGSKGERKGERKRGREEKARKEKDTVFTLYFFSVAFNILLGKI